MIRRRILFGSTGLAAAAVVGVGAMTLGSGGTSLTSGSAPSSQVAATTNSQSSNAAKPHPHFMFRGAGAAVYSERVVPQKGGSGYKKIIEVKGTLSAISSTSISVIRPDTGAKVTAVITSSTRFGNSSEAALAAEVSASPAITVRLVEVAGNAESVMVPPPPGTMPKHGRDLIRGAFPPPNGTASKFPASA